MNLRLICAGVLAFCALNSYAFNLSNTPDKCPSVTAIKARQLTNFTRNPQQPSDAWAAFQYGNQYDTQFDWDFYIVSYANDEKDAIQKLNFALDGLTFYLGPISPELGNKVGYYCLYTSTTDSKANAAAVKPGMINGQLGLSF